MAACGDRFGQISGPFPPAVTSRPLLSALTAAVECDPGLSCGVKSARRKEHDAAWSGGRAVGHTVLDAHARLARALAHLATAIQKGIRVLISLWASLMFGRVPKNAASTLLYYRGPGAATAWRAWRRRAWR